MTGQYRGRTGYPDGILWERERKAVESRLEAIRKSLDQDRIPYTVDVDGDYTTIRGMWYRDPAQAEQAQYRQASTADADPV